jgi:hypothetical protein
VIIQTGADRHNRLARLQQVGSALDDVSLNRRLVGRRAIDQPHLRGDSAVHQLARRLFPDIHNSRPAQDRARRNPRPRIKHPLDKLAQHIGIEAFGIDYLHAAFGPWRVDREAQQRSSLQERRSVLK